MNPAPAERPHFVVIGAMKAATTGLHRALARHPDIAMPARKELDHFCVPRAGARAGAAEYRHRFRRLPGAIAGEVSPAYAMFPRYGDVAARVAAALPDARVVYCVRQPAERMRSHYRHEVLRSREGRPAADALADTGYLIPSLYGLQLQRYLDCFPPAQIAVLSFAALCERPADVLGELYRFLGVDDSWAERDRVEPVFTAAGRPALSPSVERLRRAPGARRVIGSLPVDVKQRVGTRLPGASQARVQAGGLVGTEREWVPDGTLGGWLARDREHFRAAASRCHLIGDPIGEVCVGDGPEMSGGLR